MLRSLTRFFAWTIYFAVLALYSFSLWALFSYRAEQSFWSWEQVGQILQYSSLQALLSATLSILLGVFTARCFFYLSFKGKILLYKLFSFAWALPSLVVIFSLIGVWGNSGWLAQVVNFFGFNANFSLYGLHGIVLAHLFLNIPLVMKYTLEGLALIPRQRHQLAAQLNLQGWCYFLLVEFPILKGILPYAFSTVFLLCFTSFPIVLMLGGGPKYSTLEVAIYQSVVFEFDFAKAVMLILVQMAVGIFLQIAMDFSTKRFFIKTTAHKATTAVIWRNRPKGVMKKVYQLYLGLMSLFFILPLLNILIEGINALSRNILNQSSLWQSLTYSFGLSLISALSVMIIAYLIALETRQLAYRGQRFWQNWLAGLTTYPLILPIFLLAVGLFLLLIDIELSHWQLLFILGICNGLTLLPFVYRLLFNTMWNSLITPDKLSRSLGLSGIRRWWIVEKNAVIRPFVQAFALSMSASLGSFSIIAFFGNPNFSTLPYLLYQQLGSYRTAEAAVTALILSLCALFPFLMIKQNELR